MTEFNLKPPSPITIDHELTDFDSGELSLNAWLKKRALKNHATGASRCFVVCSGTVVIGYYSLSAGAISHEAAPKAMRRNMPDPLPVLLLGRLAVDKQYHNRHCCAMRYCGLSTSPGTLECSSYSFMPLLTKPNSSICHAAS